MRTAALLFVAALATFGCYQSAPNAEFDDGGVQSDVWSVSKIQSLVDGGQCSTVLEKDIKDIHAAKSDVPRLQYYFAYCLHTTGGDRNLAEELYTGALRNSDLRFWALYGRGSLHFDAGKAESAIADLQAAAALVPSHEGSRMMLEKAQAMLQQSTTQ